MDQPQTASLPGLIIAQAALHGEVTAFTHAAGGVAVTYRTLAERTARVGALLRRLDVRPGDVIAWFTGDDPWFLPTLAACAALGARLAPFDPAMHHQDFAPLLTQLHPRIVIAPCGPAEQYGQARLIMTEAWVEQAAAADLSDEAGGVVDSFQANEPCLILHSAGVTGSPKPVLLSEVNLFSAAEAFLAVHRLQQTDAVLSYAPVFTASGVALGLVIPLLAGARAVASRRPEDVWEEVARHGITLCEATPARLEGWLRQDTLPPDGVPAALRGFLCGGAKLTEALWRRFEARVGRPVWHGYGLTETTFWVACSMPDGEDRFRLKTLGHCDIAVRPLGAKFPASEIILRGPAVTKGYHRRENITHNAFENGYFRTGDVGTIDAAGTLVVCGRFRELFTREGVRLASEEIDRRLSEHPDLIESKTILSPMPPRRREQLVAVCVARDPAPPQADAIAAWLGARCETRPPRIQLVPALPRAPSGQVLTHTLRRMVSGELQEDIFKALTARKFRRNPPFDEAGLRARIEASVIAGAPLEFLAFWGCGPRDHCAAPDLAALAALRELLAEPKRLPHITTRLTLVFTDLHASSNGRSETHRNSYFRAIEDASAGMDVVFERESAVWARQGLTEADVHRFEQTDEFEAYWRGFPLRDKFAVQASRHSTWADQAASGRHYLATCRMEREVFLRAYPDAVFLTYNGPEFNDCFPALPTLYIYPGPRGPTVKPWFVE